MSLPEPNLEYVLRRLHELKGDDQFYGAERAVELVFRQWPTNVNYDEVLAKVVVLSYVGICTASVFLYCSTAPDKRNYVVGSAGEGPAKLDRSSGKAASVASKRPCTSSWIRQSLAHEEVVAVGAGLRAFRLCFLSGGATTK